MLKINLKKETSLSNKIYKSFFNHANCTSCHFPVIVCVKVFYLFLMPFLSIFYATFATPLCPNLTVGIMRTIKIAISANKGKNQGQGTYPVVFGFGYYESGAVAPTLLSFAFNHEASARK